MMGHWFAAVTLPPSTGTGSVLTSPLLVLVLMPPRQTKRVTRYFQLSVAGS